MSDAASISGPRDRRWLILAVIGLAQLMVILDLTVMNIALPSAQRALHFSTVDRQWVVTAYTLAFGSLLLLGGRRSATRAAAPRRYWPTYVLRARLIRVSSSVARPRPVR
jgi:MFS family permease